MTLISRYTAIPALMLAFGVAAATLHAQDDGTHGPPKILVIQREFVKPGKAGAMHQKTEAAYLTAAKANKAPFHYFALTSMSGPDRTLFLTGYASLSAWEAENKLVDKNVPLGVSLDRAMVADGDLLSSTEQTVWYRREELSLGHPDLLGARYMEIRQVLFKPGHVLERGELVQLFMTGYEKVPGTNWTVFEQILGTNENTLLFMTPVKSLSEVDDHLASDDKFAAALGEKGLKRLLVLQAACVESEQQNLFRIDPKMSLPADEWIKGEPDFWKPKPTPAAKPVAKSTP